MISASVGMSWHQSWNEQQEEEKEMAHRHRRRVLQHLLRGLTATQELWGALALLKQLPHPLREMHRHHHRRQEHWHSSLRSLTLLEPLLVLLLLLLSSSVPAWDWLHCSNQVEVASLCSHHSS
jgi:hypothetical protein